LNAHHSNYVYLFMVEARRKPVLPADIYSLYSSCDNRLLVQWLNLTTLNLTASGVGCAIGGRSHNPVVAHNKDDNFGQWGLRDALEIFVALYVP
jgi:hypothetical protein